MSEQRQAAIRRLRREAEALRKAIELEFSRTGASGRQASYRRFDEAAASDQVLQDGRSSLTSQKPRSLQG
jgi:hypothetical protein